MYAKPKVVIHRNKPENYENMITDCAKNVRLTKSEAQLLRFYADCVNGFRPSLLHIETATGIGTTNISRVRQGLINHGLIGYGEEFGDMLVVDWNRIRAFAMLEEPLIFDKKHPERYFSVVREAKHAIKNKRAESKTLLERGRKYKIPGIDEKNDLFLQFFGGLTEREYIQLVSAFPEYDRNKQKKPISDAEYSKYFNERVLKFSFSSKHEYDEKETEQYEKMVAFMKAAPQELPF